MNPEPRSILKRDFAHTLARGLAVLELFSAEQKTLTPGQAAERLGISRAASRRLLLTLQELGYVKSDGRAFALRPKILGLGRGLLSTTSIWSLINDDVIELADRFNEPCSITVLDGLDILYVSRDLTRRIFTTRLGVGDRLPANCSASGKLLLSALTEAEFADLLRRHGPLKGRTAKSVTSRAKLMKEMRRIREQGWAGAEDEMEENIVSIAVPLRDRDGKVVAALSLASHKLRCSYQDLVESKLPALHAVGDKISQTIVAAQHRGDVSI